MKACMHERNHEPDRIDRLVQSGVDPSMFIRYIGVRNPYGYEINISHPQIYPVLEAFKKRRGIPVWVPLGDVGRMVFEEKIIEMISKKIAAAEAAQGEKKKKVPEQSAN